MKRKNILFITAMHGDEPIGIEIVKQIKKMKLGNKFSSIIGNPRALKKQVRFIDADLNRVFPGKTDGNYEEKRANLVMEKMREFDRVIDLHGTVSKTGIFIIITKPSLKNLELALRFNIERILIWPSSKKSKGPAVSFMRSGMGIEIESGNKSNPAVKKRLKSILIDFLENPEKTIDIDEEMKKREFFSVVGKIKKRKGDGRRFKDWKKAGSFYSLFVGQYPDIACYKLKSINGTKVLNLAKRL